MYSFISTRDISELHNAYKALYGQDLDKKWNKHVVLCPDLAGAMLSGMTAKKLLTAEFRVLVNVYFHYKNYVNGMTEARRDAVNAAAQAVFTYKPYSTKIAQFLLNPDNKYEIHNCIYCDMEKISSFDHKRKKVRRFETEHVLDKGDCPLVALSLHNFVPACGHCNGPSVKGVRTIGDTIEEIKHLSPTNPSYDFWHKVLFVVNPITDAITDIKREDHPDHYEIDFRYKDTSYSKFTELFGLKSRYQEDCLKKALQLLDKKDRFTPKMLSDLANLYKKTPEEVYEDEFRVETDRREHEIYRKMKEDLMGLTELK